MISLKGFSMFRFLLLLLISLTLSAQSLSLADLSFIVQKKDKLSIVFASDVDKSLLVDYPSVYNQKSYLPLLKSVLLSNNLSLHFENGVYYVSTASTTQNNNSEDSLRPPPPLLASDSVNAVSMVDFDYSFLSYKLNYLQIDSIRPILDFSGAAYSYSTISKTILFKSTKENEKLIKKLIVQLENMDVKKEQVTLKITIFDSNSEKVREVGLNPSVSFDFSLFSQAGALLTGDAVGSFKSSLKLLSSKGATNVSHSTSYLISDNDKLDFKKVVSIPFLDENYVVSNPTGSTNQSQKYIYKDIGFVISAIPNIVGDIVYLDFSLSIGSVLSTGNLPTTSQSTITNKFSVKKGDIVLLAGISKDSLINDAQSTPFLENLPILGEIFTHKTDTSNKDYFNVSIEII